MDTQRYRFTPKAFKNIREELRPIPKKRNENLTTFEQIITYVLKNEIGEYEKILSLNDLNDLLSYIFGTDVENRGKNVGKIEHVHIKEQILANQLTGDMVEEVSFKYDGLVTFAMSGLTLLSNTSYCDEYSPFLNEMLEKLGSSTKMILVQTRLNRNIKKFLKLKDLGKYNFSHEIIKDIQPDKPQFLQDLEDTIQKSLWEEYLQIYEEFIAIFTDLLHFFDNFIKDINNIIADLFSSGFRGSIPSDDIVICEKAGIQIRNLIETSSSKRIKIKDDIVDIHMNLIRIYEQSTEKLDEILQIKSTEEGFTSSIDQSKKKFTSFYETYKKFYSNVRHLPIIQGYQESIYMGSRILYSSLHVLNELEKLIFPLENYAFNAENLPKFEEIIQFIPEFQLKLTNMEILFSVINRLCTYLFQLNREYVVECGKDPKYLQDANLILEKIKDIPSILKREAQQKLIIAEERDKKLEIFEKLIKEIQKLSEISITHRSWVLAYSISEFEKFS